MKHSILKIFRKNQKTRIVHFQVNVKYAESYELIHIMSVFGIILVLQILMQIQKQMKNMSSTKIIFGCCSIFLRGKIKERLRKHKTSRSNWIFFQKTYEKASLMLQKICLWMRSKNGCHSSWKKSYGDSGWHSRC